MGTPLGRYLAKNKLTHSELARRAELDDSYVWRLAHGTRSKPTLEVALRIQAATDGKVRPTHWPHLRDVVRAMTNGNNRAA